MSLHMCICDDTAVSSPAEKLTRQLGERKCGVQRPSEEQLFRRGSVNAAEDSKGWPNPPTAGESNQPQPRADEGSPSRPLQADGENADIQRRGEGTAPLIDRLSHVLAQQRHGVVQIKGTQLFPMKGGWVGARTPFLP